MLYNKPTMPETASPLLVARALITDNERILMVQRSHTDTHNAGLWEVPGGKVDDGEGIIEGLMRETHEETGLSIELVSPMAHVESRVIEDGKYAGRLHVSLFYVARRLSGIATPSHEHEAAEWEFPHLAHAYDLTTPSRLALASFRNIGLLS